MNRPPADLSLMRLLGGVVMAWVLLLAQQGSISHPLSHSHLAASGKAGADHPASGSGCELCHAFAAIGGAPEPTAVPPTLLSGLRFHLPGSRGNASADTAQTPPRSRGPPSPS